MAKATTQEGAKQDTKSITLDATKQGKGGFVAPFAASTPDSVIKGFEVAFKNVLSTAEGWRGATERLADAMDEMALSVATKGRSKDARIKDGQQQEAYKRASKYLKEVKGYAVDSSAIRTARYRARLAAKEAAKRAARIAAGLEAEPEEEPAVKAARLVRENITRAGKKDAGFEDIIGGVNALVDRLRDVKADAAVAADAEGKPLKDEYVGMLRNASALFAAIADEYESFVPAPDVDAEELAQTG